MTMSQGKRSERHLCNAYVRKSTRVKRLGYLVDKEIAKRQRLGSSGSTNDTGRTHWDWLFVDDSMASARQRPIHGLTNADIRGFRTENVRKAFFTKTRLQRSRRQDRNLRPGER